VKLLNEKKQVRERDKIERRVKNHSGR